jgi:hypothetical protein
MRVFAGRAGVCLGVGVAPSDTSDHAPPFHFHPAAQSFFTRGRPAQRERLDAAETAMLASIQRRMGDAGGRRDAFLSLFRSFDTDGSGFVSLEELNRGLRRLGHPLSAVELQVGAGWRDRVTEVTMLSTAHSPISPLPTPHFPLTTPLSRFVRGLRFQLPNASLPPHPCPRRLL